MTRIKLFEIITQLELGGAQLSTLNLIRELEKEKYEVFLVTSDRGMLQKDALSISNIRVIPLPSLRRNINVFYDLKALFDLYKLFKEQRPDIVHTHSSKAGIIGRWAARFAGVNIIIHTAHGWGFHRFQGKIKKRIFTLLERITAVFTDRIITVTNHDINKGMRAGIGRKDSYSLVRRGIEKEKFSFNHNGSFRKEKGIAGDCFVIGMISCFKPQKSPLDFVACAAEVSKHISNVRFVMVGDGIMRGKIEGLIERLGLEKKFLLLGWQRNIPYILSSFDVLALSSLWEGSPIVFLEAMACGKPIVATDINGNSEIVRNNVNGFLVRPKDPHALAERITYLFNNRHIAKRMGEDGRRILDENFDIKHMSNRIHSIYQSCLKDKVAV